MSDTIRIWHWERGHRYRDTPTEEFGEWSSSEDLYISESWKEIKTGPQEIGFWTSLGTVPTVTSTPAGQILFTCVSPNGLELMDETFTPITVAVGHDLEALEDDLIDARSIPWVDEDGTAIITLEGQSGRTWIIEVNGDEGTLIS